MTIELLSAATLFKVKKSQYQNSKQSCDIIKFQIPGVEVETDETKDETSHDTEDNLLLAHRKEEQISPVTSTELTTTNHDEAQSTHHTELASQHDLNDDNSTSKKPRCTYFCQAVANAINSCCNRQGSYDLDYD